MVLRGGEISTIVAFLQTENKEGASVIKGGKTQEKDSELSLFIPIKCFSKSCDELFQKSIKCVEIKYTLHLRLFV